MSHILERLHLNEVSLNSGVFFDIFIYTKEQKNMTKEERLQKMCEWVKGFDETIIRFDDNTGWETIQRKPKKDGWYPTIRVGLGGIYKVLDQYINGEFQLACLDNSRVIAYGKEPVEIPEFE